MTARCSVVSREASTHAPHYETVFLLTRMTAPPSGPLASLAHFAWGCSGQARTRRAMHTQCSTDRADNRVTLLRGPMDLLSVGVKPACGASCGFQCPKSVYDLTEWVHDAKRRRVFWCWQIHDGKPAAACERLAQPIDRPFSHVGHLISSCLELGSSALCSAGNFRTSDSDGCQPRTGRLNGAHCSWLRTRPRGGLGAREGKGGRQ